MKRAILWGLLVIGLYFPAFASGPDAPHTVEHKRPTFGDINGFLGQELLGTAFTLKFTAVDDDESLLIEHGTPDGRVVTREHISRGANPGELVGVAIIGGTKTENRLVRLLPDGSLEVITLSVSAGQRYWEQDGILTQQWVQYFPKDKRTELGATPISFLPPTPETRAAAAEYLAGAPERWRQIQLQYAERERRERAEKAAGQQAAFDYLQGQLAIANANEAESRASLDATLDVQAQRRAKANATQRASNSGGEKIADVSSVAPSVVVPKDQTPIVPAKASSAATPSEAAGETMTFMLGISLGTVINRMNGECFSNLISIPGPPGWPGAGPGRGNGEEARALVRKYFSEFLAKCGQIAPLGRGEPFYVWNNRGNEARLLEEYSRAKRNQMVEVHISP